MTRKILLLIFLMAIAFVGCGKKEKKLQGLETQERPSFVVKENNSLMGWLKRGKAVECEVESEEGAITMLTKGDSVRIEGVPYMSMNSSGEAPSAENGVMLADKDWTYLWDKKTKQGTKMNNQKMAEISGEQESTSQESWEDMVEAWEAQKVKYSCQEVTARSDLFSEPEGINFTDLTEMMSGMAEIGKQMEAQIEAGEQPDLKALEEIGKQLEESGFEGIDTSGIR